MSSKNAGSASPAFLSKGEGNEALHKSIHCFNSYIYYYSIKMLRCFNRRISFIIRPKFFYGLFMLWDSFGSYYYGMDLFLNAKQA